MTEAKAAAPKLVRAPEIKALHAHRIKGAEFAYKQYDVEPEHGHTVKDMLDPGYWKHVTHLLEPGAQIRALPEDFSFFAELLVVQGGTEPRLVLLREVKLEAGIPTAEQSGSHKVEWAGRYDKFRIVRVKDNAVIEKGIANKVQAYERLAQIAA